MRRRYRAFIFVRARRHPGPVSMGCAVFMPHAWRCDRCSANASIRMANANTMSSGPSLGRALNGLIWPHPAGFLAARYIVMRGLGVIFLSAFYSYAFQIQGLIGPHGISPAVNYLNAAREHLELPARYFQVPTIFGSRVPAARHSGSPSRQGCWPQRC